MSLSELFPIDRWNFSTRSILNVLSDEDYRYLISNRSNERYQRGDVIFREGSVPSGIFLIVSGRIKKYKVDQNGKEQVIYIANQGELIGYHAILSEERYPDSAAALENCVVSFIPKEDFMEVLHRSPFLTQRLLKAMSHEFTVLSNSISVLAHRTAAERLAIALIVLREKFKEEGVQKEVVINISRSDLANMVGIAQENVVRILKEFKSEHILETHGRNISIKNIKLLVKRTNYK